MYASHIAGVAYLLKFLNVHDFGKYFEWWDMLKTENRAGPLQQCGNGGDILSGPSNSTGMVAISCQALATVREWWRYLPRTCSTQ